MHWDASNDGKARVGRSQSLHVRVALPAAIAEISVCPFVVL